MAQFNNAGGSSNLAGLMGSLGQKFGKDPAVAEALGGLKNMEAAEDMSEVPMATGGFYQPMEQPARAQLLQTMMQRSRAGRNPQGA